VPWISAHRKYMYKYPKLGGSAVRALDTRPKDPRFNAQPMYYQVTTLGKLFTLTCMCRCKWSNGWCRLVTFRLRFDSRCRHLQATLSKLPTYYVLRPTQPPTLRGRRKAVVAYGLRGEVLVWLIEGGMSASCKPQVQLFVNAGNGWLHSALRYH